MRAIALLVLLPSCFPAVYGRPISPAAGFTIPQCPSAEVAGALASLGYMIRTVDANAGVMNTEWRPVFFSWGRARDMVQISNLRGKMLVQHSVECYVLLNYNPVMMDYRECRAISGYEDEMRSDISAMRSDIRESLQELVPAPSDGNGLHDDSHTDPPSAGPRILPRELPPMPDSGG